MGQNDRNEGISELLVCCNTCGKKYSQWLEYQIPGCRSKDHDICPYCSAINNSSMEVEFHNKKLTV